MKASDTVSAASLLVGGVLGGVLLGGVVAVVIGGLIGSVLAGAAITLRLRPLVAISLAGGSLAGLFVGGAVVRVLCLPSRCPALETFGGLVTAAGALVGVGVVAALAARSFDEYREAVAAGRPPPEPGCESADDED